MRLPPPRIERIDGIDVVRDDEIPGGTKQRVLVDMLVGCHEAVYAGPAFGYAQLALAHAAAMTGTRAVLFVAKRKDLHARTAAAARAGAKVIQVPAGYLNVVQARARAYCDATGARLIPFGLDTPTFAAKMAAVARGLKIKPREVWTVAGSGTLTRALQAAWPVAVFNAVLIGKECDVGRAKAWRAPEAFEDDAGEPPPFPSCSNYDAKAWRFLRESAGPGALFWNVGA